MKQLKKWDRVKLWETGDAQAY